MKLRKTCILSLAILIFPSCGIYNAKPKPTLVENAYSVKFEEIWQRILLRSVSDIKNTDEDKLKCALNIMSGGLSRCLDDPNSKYYTKLEWKNYNARSESSFVGIGLHLTEYHNRVMIITPIRGSPAGNSRAFAPGDFIERVDGASVVGESLEEVVNKIAWPIGTQVTIQVRRSGKLLPVVNLKRAEIVERSVESELISNDIYLIKVNEFKKTFFWEFFETFAKAISDSGGNIPADNPQKSVIIDLRNNPGGYLATVKFASYLFATNPESIVVTLKEKNGERVTLAKEIIAQVHDINPDFIIPPGIFANTRMVVLINNGSASASEIFAALLRDWLSVSLVGEYSFGKGSVQDVLGLSDDDGLKITSAEYFVGNSKIKVNKIGLAPDYPISNRESQSNATIPGVPPLVDLKNDAQLKKAIELLREPKHSTKILIELKKVHN